MSKNALTQAVSGGARAVIATQAVILLASVLGAFALAGTWAGLSAGYGGLVAMALAWLLSRRVARAGEAAGQDSGRGMLVLFIGLAQRFVLVLVLLGVGLGVFKLHALATITGFALTQLGYLTGMRTTGSGHRGSQP